ncbi:hypothetical protein Tco_1291909 [Tanacetum coccineum]
MSVPVMFRDIALPPRDKRQQYLRREVHRDAQGVSLFTSRAWRRIFDIRGLLFQLRGARPCLSWRQFTLALGLHTAEEMETVGFDAYWAESARQIPDKGDLRDYWIRTISWRFPWHNPILHSIRDPILRLCHRGMDIGSINVPYLLSRYLRLFAAGRKSGALISRGQFIA